MKLLLLLTLCSFTRLLFAQDITYIDSLKRAIDGMTFNTVISIYDTAFAAKERKITAFMCGDTVKKVIVTFKGSPRIRQVYMGYVGYYENKVFYIKDIDSTNGKLLFEVYGWNGKLIKSNVVAALDSEELNNRRLALDNADYDTRIKFYIVDSKADKYIFKCKLTEEVQFPPGCGIVAWALVQKFEVVETDCPGYNNKFVLIIQPCPEFTGQAFFKKGRIYKARVATNSGVTFGFSIVNKYKQETVPIFWSREIESIPGRSQ